MEMLEGRWWRDRRASGVRFALVGVGSAVVAGIALEKVCRRLSGAPLVLAAALATAVTCAGRALGAAAGEVAHALERDDLSAARAALPTLVGRDPTGLDEKEIARAAVESVAENTVDAVVAPALWGALGGAPAAFGYRAVNTLDAMVGYRDDRFSRFGWASARLDDVANWIPARATAIAVGVSRPGAAGAVWRVVRRDARRHPSPNAGVAEAAFAAALGLRLGGRNRYGTVVEVRAQLGEGRSPETDDIHRAVELSRDVSRVLAMALALPGVAGVVAGGLRRTRHRRRFAHAGYPQ
jgi:adenosylcobinamide-phosphate synthase